MSNLIIESLTAAGAPFEFTETLIRHQPCRVFKKTPQFLSQIYDVLPQFDERTLAVCDDKRLSYLQARQQATQLAGYIKNHHQINAGDRVGIAMRNTPEWLVSFIAVTSIGGVATLVNSKGKQDEMNYCINLTRCKLVLTDEETITLLDTVEQPKVIVEQQLAARQEEMNDEARLPRVSCNPEDTALILFTSGTTGRPKGAQLSHRGVLTALMTNQFSGAIIGAQIAQKYNIDLQTLTANRPQSCTLLMFPLFHVSGCQAVFLSNLLQGGKVVMMPRWNVDHALALIESEKVTSFPGVPTMYWDILQSEKLSQYDMSSLSSLSVAGQSTPITLLNRIVEAFPQAILGCGYGMTETNGAISLIIGEDLIAAPDSVGHAVATTDIKLLKDDGTEAVQGEKGEVTVRGATIMNGYDNQPEANDKSFVDGWYKTGDIGYFDEQQRLYIVDRATEMVITSGENIYCAEVERALGQVDDVIETATFGMPDDRLGEKLIALIRLSQGSIQTVDSIIEHAGQHLAKYKLPVETYLIDKPLERNQSGKVLKASAKQFYTDIMSNNVN